MRDSSIRRRAGRVTGWVAAATLMVALWLPAGAGAMCCVCRDCGGASFCVDGLGNSLACSNFCFTNGCPSTVFDSVDTCAGGCDGAPEAPTATVSATPSLTPTATATGTATGSATPSASATATGAASATATATASDSPTPSATPTHSPTATVTATSAASTTPTETPTDTPSASPSATPTGSTSQLSGHVRYFNGGGPVPGATVALLGATPGSTTTDAEGNYGFSAAGPGDLTVQPSKDGQFNAAVTSFDAVLVLQAIAGTITLTHDQEFAADVTGNGTFSTLDATRILQFQAGLLTRFPAADLCQSDWLFVPEPSPTPNQTLVEPVVGGGSCQPGGIALTPLTPPLAGRDFRAILLGDVSGNWQP